MNDVIVNGQAHGSVAARLLSCGFNANALRPWVGRDGRSYITQNSRGKSVAVPLIGNTAATLRKDEWKLLDEAVVGVARQRLRIVSALRGAGLQYTIPQGMGKTVLETQTQTDITDAEMHMDPAVPTEQDRPHFDLTTLPLPVIHKDFSFSAREIAVSRNGGSPLDVTGAELATRKVAEAAEKLTLGVSSTYKFGGGTIYGLINYPNAITTVTLTAPTATAWTPEDTVEEVLAMRQASQDALHYGPWMLYNSPAWDQYLDRDYNTTSGKTLRARLSEISNIRGVETADYMGSGFKMVLVQQTSDVVRMVVGMDVTTVQWESMGGLRVHFKVMAILVPQVRCDSNSNTGIVYATTE